MPTFQRQTLDQVKNAFADTIADYIGWCREQGKELLFHGSVSPEPHRRIAAAAARDGKSINADVATTLERQA